MHFFAVGFLSLKFDFPPPSQISDLKSSYPTRFCFLRVLMPFSVASVFELSCVSLWSELISYTLRRPPVVKSVIAACPFGDHQSQITSHQSRSSSHKIVSLPRALRRRGNGNQLVSGGLRATVPGLIQMRDRCSRCQHRHRTACQPLGLALCERFINCFLDLLEYSRARAFHFLGGVYRFLQPNAQRIHSQVWVPPGVH